MPESSKHTRHARHRDTSDPGTLSQDSDRVPLCHGPAFRPSIIEGGYRRNRTEVPIRAGWPWVSDRWRLWVVLDGTLIWHHGREQHRLISGDWYYRTPTESPATWTSALAAIGPSCALRFVQTITPATLTRVNYGAKRWPPCLKRELTAPHRATCEDILVVVARPVAPHTRRRCPCHAPCRTRACTSRNTATGLSPRPPL